MRHKANTRGAQTPTPLERADLLLREHRFGEAISGYEARLAAEPRDLAALLKLGICHLLNRSEEEFLRIFQVARERVSATSELSGDLQGLWNKYQGLAGRVTAGALVLGSLAATGCTAAETPESTHKPTTEATAVPTTTVAPPPRQNPQEPPYTGHKYSGGVYLPLEEDPGLVLFSDDGRPIVPEKTPGGGPDEPPAGNDAAK